MPREMIHGTNTGPFHVKVGWAAHEDVQVGVEGDDGRSLFWLLYGATEEDRRVLGQHMRHLTFGDAVSDADRGAAVLDVLDSLSTADKPGYAGVWAFLDRSAINRLIRLLRKARDSAFGADA